MEAGRVHVDAAGKLRKRLPFDEIAVRNKAPQRSPPGGTRPSPYFVMKLLSQMSHAGIVGTLACERYIPSTKS
jgi:hypothetical protein